VVRNDDRERLFLKDNDQCWDLPNYILKRYWGFVTWGNANAMANPANYRGYDFTIYTNTSSFIPKPGDWAVWAGTNPGHVSIVVGPSTTSYFYSVDQNFYTNNAYGSPAYKIKHTYNGVTHFVRPPYKEGVITPPVDDNPDQTPVAESERFRDVKKIEYTLMNKEFEGVDGMQHFIVDSKKRTGDPKGVLIRNAATMRNVKDLYKDRGRLMDRQDLPHFYVDRKLMWACRPMDMIAPYAPDMIVIDVCEDFAVNDETFTFNEVAAMVLCYTVCRVNRIEFKASNIHAERNIWRSMLLHEKWDMLKNSFPDTSKYDSLEKAFIGIYDNMLEIISTTPEESVERFRIKVTQKNKNRYSATSTTKQTITKETSSYTFDGAVGLQMTTNPQVNVSTGWVSASQSETKSAMNVSTIFKSTTQIYQMLHLGKYQGIAVSKLNQILKGKGKLDGMGQAFADACKQYNINEVYLISHALLESGNGYSNYASGVYGYYNFFGIGAYDSNPDYAMTLAKDEGWTTPEKAIKGGARFVRKDYIDVGQNTLYRMRWNPKKPATHQYASDIKWASHQASSIASYYKAIGLKGQYYIYDQYK